MTHITVIKGGFPRKHDKWEEFPKDGNGGRGMLAKQRK